MKTFCKYLLIAILFLFAFSCISGCTTKTTVISTNNFIQTDYNYNCLEGDKTFTQIILCYQTQDKAEKVQNKVTNELIQGKK